MLLAAAAACGGGDPQPRSLPSTASTTPTAVATSPTPDPLAWRGKYIAEQLAAYDQALQRFTAYEEQSEPIWAAGRATPAAEALFKTYFPSPLWQSYYQQLQSYQASRVTRTGLPTVLWSRAKAIGKDATTVTVRQCVDFTTSKTFQNGQPATQDDVFKAPLIRTIQLDMPQGYDWLIYQIDGPTPKKFERCSASQS